MGLLTMRDLAGFGDVPPRVAPLPGQALMDTWRPDTTDWLRRLEAQGYAEDQREQEVERRRLARAERLRLDLPLDPVTPGVSRDSSTAIGPSARTLSYDEYSRLKRTDPELLRDWLQSGRYSPPADLWRQQSGAPSPGMDSRTQQQEAWEHGTTIKRTFTDQQRAVRSEPEARAAADNARAAADHADSPAARVIALEDALAYDKEADRLATGGPPRGFVPVKASVRWDETTSGQDAEIQQREMERRGVRTVRPPGWDPRANEYYQRQRAADQAAGQLAEREYRAQKDREYQAAVAERARAESARERPAQPRQNEADRPTRGQDVSVVDMIRALPNRVAARGETHRIDADLAREQREQRRRTGAAAGPAREHEQAGIVADLARERVRLRREARLAADNDLAKAQADQRRAEDDRRRVEGERLVEAADQSAWTEAARISRPPQSVADLRARHTSGAAALTAVRDARRAQAKADSDQYWAREAEAAEMRFQIQDGQDRLARQAIAAKRQAAADQERRLRESQAAATARMREQQVASVAGGAAGTAVASGQRPPATAAATGGPATGYAAFTARPPVYGSPPLPCPYGQRTPTGGCAGGAAAGGGARPGQRFFVLAHLSGYVARQARDLHMGAF